MGKWDSIYDEVAQASTPAVMTPEQRAAYSTMEGKDREAYLTQEFGQGNVQAAGSDYQIRSNPYASWQPTDPPNHSVGDVMGDVAGFAGPLVKYAPAVVGSLAGPLGGVAGAAAGSSWNKILANALLKNGSQKNTAEQLLPVAGDTALAVGAMGAGKLAGAAYKALKPGASIASEALGSGAAVSSPNVLSNGVPAQILDTENPVIAAALQQAANPAKRVAATASQNLGLGDGIAAGVGGFMGGPLGSVAGVAAKRGTEAIAQRAEQAFASKSASAIAKIAQEPGGLEALKALAQTGRTAPQGAMVGLESLRAIFGGQ